MNHQPCTVPNCVRMLNHAGAHTAAPSTRTLDWDADRLTERILDGLDFPAPHWADLNDD